MIHLKGSVILDWNCRVMLELEAFAVWCLLLVVFDFSKNIYLTLLFFLLLPTTLSPTSTLICIQTNTIISVRGRG